MEMCVAITEMEGAFGFEFGCAIIPVIPSLKCIYLENHLPHHFEKTLQALLCFVYCQLWVTCRPLDICYVPVVLLNVFLEHFELIRGV